MRTSVLFALFFLFAVISSTVTAQVVSCTTCKFVITWVENEIENPTSEAEIEKLLDEACAILGNSSYGQECVALVNSYTPSLISYIIAKETPSVACGEMALCNSTMVAVPKVPEVGGDLECDACQLIVQWVENEVNNENQDIETAFDDVCDALGPIASICTDIVNTYEPELIKWIEADETPTVACTQIGLCGSSSGSGSGSGAARVIISKL